MLYGSIPRYKHLKIFGCAVYALKPHAKLEGKLGPRSEKLWLLGYDATTIFRLWNPVKRIVRTSRNVTFNEAELATAGSMTSSTTTKTTNQATTEPTEKPTFRPTTRSMTRKSTSQEAVEVSEPIKTADLAIVMPERDPEIEYENWTTEVLTSAKAFYATT